MYTARERSLELNRQLADEYHDKKTLEQSKDGKLFPKTGSSKLVMGPKGQGQLQMNSGVDI